MLVPPYVVALFAHFVADFPVQAAFHRWMGKKATRLDHLLWHVLSYITALVLVVVIIQTVGKGPYVEDMHGRPIVVWAILNGILHGCIDLWTSKWTKGYWSRHVELDGPCDHIDGPGVYAHAHVWVKDNRYAGPFFNVIGLDQWAHVVFLLWSGFTMGVL